jgi:ketosteroid isomerase-like protein
MSETARPAAEQFMAALQAFEAGGQPEPLLRLFADDAELSNYTRTERGRDGARRFWQEYRATFGVIRLRFTAVIAGDGGVALEWESAGTLPTGSPIRYRGVSLLELGGDRVRRFRTYYDSAAFVPPAVPPRAGA